MAMHLLRIVGKDGNNFDINVEHIVSIEQVNGESIITLSNGKSVKCPCSEDAMQKFLHAMSVKDDDHFVHTLPMP